MVTSHIIHVFPVSLEFLAKGHSHEKPRGSSVTRTQDPWFTSQKQKGAEPRWTSERERERERERGDRQTEAETERDVNVLIVNIQVIYMYFNDGMATVFHEYEKI